MTHRGGDIGIVIISVWKFAQEIARGAEKELSERCLSNIGKITFRSFMLAQPSVNMDSFAFYGRQSKF